MNCLLCHTKNPATARFCLNCGAALVRRCASCQVELPPNARFCMHCGHAVQASTPADKARRSRLAAAAPAPFAQKVRAAAPLTGERRVVTVLFVDVVGSTNLAEQLDVEAWTAVMNGAFERVSPVIYRYEGTIARLMGDALVAFFGAPVAHEDDPVRAVRAALDLLDPVREYAEHVREKHGVDFAMRFCLSTGPVVVGPVGDDLTYEYTATGGVVNMAARIKFAAQPMTVVVSEDTYRCIAPLFECAGLGAIGGQERTDSVALHRVLGVRAGPVRVRGLVGLESPMVGRDAELAALLQLSDALQAGLGRAALVIGEPGVGKTRLIAEWRAAVEARPAGLAFPQWAEGRGLSYGQGLPYHLLVDLLRSVIGVPPAAEEGETRAALLACTEALFAGPEGSENVEAMDVYPYLGHLLSIELEGEAWERVRPLDPQAIQAQYLAATRRLLGAMAARRPLVLVLEDLHWTDPSSAELLTQLLPLASTAPLLFCLVTRAERDTTGWKLVTAARDVSGGSLTELTLGALSEDDSRKLVANLLEIEDLPETTRSVILGKAEGNPFFVEELIRMLIDRGVISRREGRWVAEAEIDTVAIPDNLQGLLLARIDRLPEDVRDVLRVAAVIGRRFPLRVLERVLMGGG